MSNDNDRYRVVFALDAYARELGETLNRRYRANPDDCGCLHLRQGILDTEDHANRLRAELRDAIPQ